MSDIKVNKVPFVRSMTFKLLMISAVVFTLLICLVLLNGIVAERQSSKNEATTRTISEWGGSQKILGPIVLIHWEKTVSNENGKREIEEGSTYLVPETLRTVGKMTTETRNRGIYDATLYQIALSLTGEFRLPSSQGWLSDNVRVNWSKTEIVFGISGEKGLIDKPRLTVNGQKLEMERSDSVDGIGVKRPFWSSLNDNTSLAFEIDLSLRGGGGFALYPIAKDNEIQISSDWKSPEFGGQYLPTKRAINENGFEAEWKVPALSRKLANYGNSTSVLGELNDYVSFNIINPIDSYKVVERSVKYGVLFIIIPFIAFFLFEIMAGVQAHPLQYLFMGLAVVIFYLLFLSLSERLNFQAGFVISAGATSVLCGIYARFMLGTWMRGLYCGVGLIALYVMLFVIVQSEDDALLVGSIFLFVLLTITMFITRKVDWFKKN